ncbi:MAG: alanine--tRNA ligase-related protein, partial [Anaerolineae bacterium]
MTELLYLTDAYLKEFEAVVTAVTEQGVVLDRTAFYPGGGGQPCDFGTLTAGGQTWPVTKVKKLGGQVVHFVDGEGSIPDFTLRFELTCIYQ